MRRGQSGRPGELSRVGELENEKSAKKRAKITLQKSKAQLKYFFRVRFSFEWSRGASRSFPRPTGGERRRVSILTNAAKPHHTTKEEAARHGQHQPFEQRSRLPRRIDRKRIASEGYGDTLARAVCSIEKDGFPTNQETN